MRVSGLFSRSGFHATRRGGVVAELLCSGVSTRNAICAVLGCVRH